MRRRSPILLVAAGVAGVLCQAHALRGNPPAVGRVARRPIFAPVPPRDQAAGWTVLFDGKTLDGWKPTIFGGEGEVTVRGGEVRLAFGNDLTGITIDRAIPRNNYEIALEACRVDGNDFFCGLTFPVKQAPCSLILGGWGGSVCGLSSIDGFDASENSTTKYVEFTKGRWYAVRVRVTDDKIEAWLDGEKLIDQSLADKTISIRGEVDASRPLGVASYRTAAALRHIRLRQLK